MHCATKVVLDYDETGKNGLNSTSLKQTTSLEMRPGGLDERGLARRGQVNAYMAFFIFTQSGAGKLHAASPTGYR